MSLVDLLKVSRELSVGGSSGISPEIFVALQRFSELSNLHASQFTKGNTLFPIKDETSSDAVHFYESLCRAISRIKELNLDNPQDAKLYLDALSSFSGVIQNTCVSGPDFQIICVNAGVHSLILELFIKFNHTGIYYENSEDLHTKISKIFKALTNITSCNDATKDTFLCDTIENSNLCIEMLNRSLLYDTEEYAVLIVSGIIFDSESRCSRLVSSNCFPSVIKEIMKIIPNKLFECDLMDAVSQFFLTISNFGFAREILKLYNVRENVDNCAETRMPLEIFCLISSHKICSKDTGVDLIISLLDLALQIIKCLANSPEYEFTWSVEAISSSFSSLRESLQKEKFITSDTLFAKNRKLSLSEKHVMWMYNLMLIIESISNILERMDPNSRDELARKSFCKNITNIFLLLKETLPRFNKSKQKDNQMASIHDLCKNPLFDFKSKVVSAVANASFDAGEMKKNFAKVEILPLLLDSCSLDTLNPLLREHSIFAIKILCDNSPENQKFVKDLKPIGIHEDILV